VAEFILIPISADDAESAGITEHTAVESYLNGNNEIVVRALTDIDDYVCGRDCDTCIFDRKSCAQGRKAEPYVCRCRAINPLKKEAVQGEDT
jgi:hypothetical protein